MGHRVVPGGKSAVLAIKAHLVKEAVPVMRPGGVMRHSAQRTGSGARSLYADTVGAITHKYCLEVLLSGDGRARTAIFQHCGDDLWQIVW